MNNVTVANFTIGKGQPLCVIAGPDVIEDQGTLEHVAGTMCELAAKLGLNYIFKASYEKDNRGSEQSYIGPRLERGLEMLAGIREKFGCPITSDTHRMEDVPKAADVLDLMQIPAYLCQQTSLVLRFAEVGKPVNVKKAQFLSPENMSSAIGKLRRAGNNQILVTERGTCFGYNRLISDVTCIPIIQSLGVPVVYDATHIVRMYGYSSSDMEHGGFPQYVPHLVRSGIAAGANALFIETHPEPERALCDAASMWRLDRMEELLTQAKTFHEHLREWNLS